MDVQLVVCAESASIDQQTNKLSLFGVMEELQGVGLPGLVPATSFVVLLRRTKSESQKPKLKIVVSLNGKSFFESPINADFQTHLRCRSIVNLQGVPITGVGFLEFSVKQKNKVLGSWRTDVRNIAQVSTAPPVSGSNVSSQVKPKKKKKKKAKRR